MSVKSRRAVALITVAFLLVAGVVAALYLTRRREVTTTSSSAYQAYQEGLESYRRFYYKDARVAFARALALDPNFAMAMLRLANLSNHDQAVSLVERASKLRGRLTDRERRFVEMFSAGVQRNMEERNKIARAIFEKYPDDVDTAMILCEIEMNQGRAERALQIYSELLAVDPNNVGVYNQIGYYYARRGDYDKAMENLKKYQFMAPDQANPYDSLGEVQAYSGHYDEAIANLNKSLSLKPDFFQSYANLGTAYEGKGEYARAIQNYLKAAQESMNDSERGGYLGMAFLAAMESGDRASAHQIADRFAALPKGKDYETTMSVVAAALDLLEGRPAEAERRLTEVRAKRKAEPSAGENEGKKPGYRPEWNVLMARAKVAQGKTEEAIALYEEVVNPPGSFKTFPERRWIFEARAHLAELLARKGELDRAEKLLAENKKWNPSWAPTRPAELVVEQARREKVLAASGDAASQKAPR